MGLFSDKKKTTVGTSISRLLEDDALPDSPKTGVLKAILKDGNVAEYLAEEMTASIAVRAERMYAYAERGDYVYGLPSGEFVTASQGIPEVEAVLQSITGQAVLAEYVRIAPPNSHHLGWLALTTQHGYDPVTNEFPALSAVKGETVYLDDMFVVVPASLFAGLDATALQQWGPPASGGYTEFRRAQTGALRRIAVHTPPMVSDLAVEEHVRAIVTWRTTVQQYDPELGRNVDIVTDHREEIIIPVSAYDEEKDYFHVRYIEDGVPKYWLYEAGLGTYPTLDALVDQPPAVGGSFFPFGYFRFEKTSMAADTASEGYRDSKKLMKYLNVDFDTLVEAIHENPDIDDVEQAMLMMAVPAVTEDPLEQRYLFTFFDQLYLAGNLQTTSRTRAEIEQNFWLKGDLLRTAIVIQDARFKLSLTHSGITKRRKAGTLGPVGTHQSALTSVTFQVPYTDAMGQVLELTDEKPAYVYRRQVSDVLYDEIEVVDLRTVYHIYGRYSAIGDGEDKILLVPIDRSITGDYSMPDKERLYARSLHFVFNSRIVTKVKWYQQEWFRIVIIIVAIVIIVVTYGAAFEAYAAAIAAGTVSVTALLYGILMEYVLVYALSAVAVKLFIQTVSPEIAMIVAVVAMIYGMYGTDLLANAPWADQLLQAGTSLINGIPSYLQGAMGDLLGEMNAFSREMEAQTKLLDSAQELLEGNNLLSPFILFGEKPDDFYNRTVHSGNLGVLGITMTHNYVDMALTLPKLSDTLGRDIVAPD